MYSIKDFYLGKSDGKKEAAYRKDFEEFFFNFNGIYEKVSQREKFLCLGRKGTGKTLLAEYIKKVSKKTSDQFCDLVSFRDFQFKKLKELKTDDISPNEYISIWEWILLLEFGKLALSDNSLINEIEFIELTDFLEKNYSSLTITAQKVVEETTEIKVSGKFAVAGFDRTSGTKKTSGDYLHYIEDLKKVVLGLLAKSKNRFSILLDELDDRFRDQLTYKDSIISLIKAVDRLNLEFVSKNINAKSTIFLRTDIFDVLNDPDLNKVKIDNGVMLDWGYLVSRESPLFKLVFWRIRKSVPEFSRIKNDSDLYEILFPHPINGVAPEKYLLERTFFRPRDLVQYLNMIAEKHPTTTRYGSSEVMDVERIYSQEYFRSEVRNEMSGHIDDKIIDAALLLLKQHNKPKFMFTELKSYYEMNKNSYVEFNLEQTMMQFYKFGIIGNTWKDTDRDQYFNSWYFRDERTMLDLSRFIVIHRGLRRAL